MSSSQPVRPGSPCTKMSATSVSRITACHAGPGCFPAPCGRDTAAGLFAVILCTPGEAAVHRQVKHASVCARKGRTIFRTPTGGSLSAEDRAALFHSFCRDAFHLHVCAAAFPTGIRKGRLLFSSGGPGETCASARHLPGPEQHGIGTCFAPMTLSTFFA